MSEFSAIVSALQNANSILISVHKSPDGDALGSQLALMLALEKLGKTVLVHNLDPVPEVYRFLPSWEKIRTGLVVEGLFDALVVLDSDPPRTGLFEKGFPAKQLINIDHHVTNTRMWDLTWLDEASAATGEMVYELIRMLHIPVDTEIALCLYTSIFTDTGSFRYANTTSKSLRIAAEMIEAGADSWWVTENVYESYPFRRLKLLGSVLSGMERSADGRIAWVAVTEELFRRNNATAEDTEHFVNFVRSVKGVEVAILFRQTAETQFKISLRSKGRVDLSQVARGLGGGGHRNAAGSTLNGRFEEVKEKVIGDVGKAVNGQLGNGSEADHGWRP